jgi:hypothetical protein
LWLSYKRDEGRPFRAGFQEQALNRYKLLQSKAVVVSVIEKPGCTGQVRDRETNKLEPLMKRS